MKNEAFLKPYEPKEVEEKVYKMWEESGFFNPDKLPIRHKKSFTIIMPPPNANGSLHIGHAVFVTLEDIMIRYQRMKGLKALWLPGADHAGFETQVVYDKKLEKEGRSRFKIPRDELYKEMMEFTLTNKKVMENQLRRLGASCDWSRERFTLDENIVKGVYRTFEELKKDDLIYKGKRIISWCVKHQTSLSDVEVKYEERTGRLFYVKYAVLESNDCLTVATTRPETIPADVALAVNPKDARYKNFIGRYAVNPLNNEKLLIISDRSVDKDFGTGVLKVTPDHDKTDEEIYGRHQEIDKEAKRIINLFGRLEGENVPQELIGLKIREAREKAVEILKRENKMDEKFGPGGVDSQYKSSTALCYKCGTEVEPLSLNNQWFVKMTAMPKSGGKSLRDAAVDAVKSGKIKFVPKRYEKVFFHWMKNLKDWNISRQIIWGIKIPDDSEGQVFDTWFSSGQWPFLSLGFGKSSDLSNAKLKVKSSKLWNDFDEFYPTDVMETGWDILFFWVARMIMLGLYQTKKAPFKYVYLHGLVRDKERQKMSKSKGNVIDPLGVIDLYGADALRMALIVGNTPGNDPVIFEEKIKGYRNFANKIWQASRFVLTNTQDFDSKVKPKLIASDKKRLKELDKLCKDITKQIESFKFYAAAENLYHYFWHTFCDKIIEECKPRLSGENKSDREAAQYALLEILKTSLKLLHPFMPHITEEIWANLPSKNKNLLIIEKWPK